MKSAVMIIAIAALIGAGFIARSTNQSYARAQATELAVAPANADSTVKLNALKQFVESHSGATITVQLTAAYNSAVQTAEAATASSTPSSSLYAAAQAACASHAAASVVTKCNEDYVQAHLTPAIGAALVALPKLSDYTYHFVSPLLTLDTTTVFWGIGFILILVLLYPLYRSVLYF
jgi:hypothetical protein